MVPVNFIPRFDSLQSMASKEALRSSGKGREFPNLSSSDVNTKASTGNVP
jgi:hypothetical protein